MFLKTGKKRELQIAMVTYRHNLRRVLNLYTVP